MQNQSPSSDLEFESMAFNNNNIQLGLSRLPDLVIDKIVQHLPTKPAVHASFLSKQWEGRWSSTPLLNFDEDDDFDRHKHNLFCYADYARQHNRFVNFLEGYFEYCEKVHDRKAELHLDKLRLHMTMYVCEEATMIDKWLGLAFERGVKELDLRLDQSIYASPYCNFGSLYSLPWATLFVNAKFLTSLTLQNVAVKDIDDDNHDYERLLIPSMKTMSCIRVSFEDEALPSLLSKCPSLENLSLTGCSFGSKDECRVTSSSLQSLEIMRCPPIEVLHVDQVCSNLKRIHIRSERLKQFLLQGGHRSLEATINTQMNIYDFSFYGHLKAKVCVKACGLANIEVGELWNQKAGFLWDWTHFPTLIGFLRGFACSENVVLHNQYSKALIIPQHLRNTSSSPLLNTQTLTVAMPHPPAKMSKDCSDLMDSLRWIAPSAREISIEQVTRPR